MWGVLPPWSARTWCLASTGRQVCLLVVCSGVSIEPTAWCCEGLRSPRSSIGSRAGEAPRAMKCSVAPLAKKVGSQPSLSHCLLIPKVAMRRHLT